MNQDDTKRKPKSTGSTPLVAVRVALLGCVVALGCGRPAPASPEPPKRSYRFLSPAVELDCPPPAAATDSCSLASLEACLEQVKASPGADTTALRAAYRTLQQGCLEQGPCACAQFGDALTHSAEPERQREGLDHLEDACKAGVLNACDEGVLLASLCAVDSIPAYCGELRRAGVIPTVEPDSVWREAALPRELHGCREGLVELGVVMPCPEVPGMECRVGEPDHANLTLCVEAARVLWKADDWDVTTIRWESGAAGAWRAVDQRGDVVLSIPGKGDDIQLRSGDAVLRRVPSVRATVLQQEIAKLPTTREMCVAAAACQRALDRALEERGGEEDLEGEGSEDTLSACREALNEARAQLESLNPELARKLCSEVVRGR